MTPPGNNCGPVGGVRSATATAEEIRQDDRSAVRVVGTVHVVGVPQPLAFVVRGRSKKNSRVPIVH